MRIVTLLLVISYYFLLYRMKKYSKLRRTVWFYSNMHWLFVGVIILFILNGTLTLFIGGWSDRGTFGDQFGAVNALFSGLAFAGLIITILLQRRDLRLQRKDLRMQRKELQLNRQEMEAQTAEFEKQNATLLKQTFETTFFHMLELHKQNVQEINVQGAKGRDSMVMLIDTLNRLYYSVYQGLEEIIEYKNPDVDIIKEAKLIVCKWNDEIKRNFTIKYAYGIFFYGTDFHLTYNKESDVRIVEECVHFLKSDHIVECFGKTISNVYPRQGYSTALGHYYRHIFQTVCFVDKQEDLNDKEKYDYVKMLRAQLSDYEQVLFYYNALSSMGYPWIQANGNELPLVIKYRMIKNIPHFLQYIFNDPRVEFKCDIEKWKRLHPGEHFFEQVKNLN